MFFIPDRDPFAFSAPILRKEDYVRQKEEERIAKEEEDRKKAEEAAKKAEEKKKKDEEKRLEAEKKAEEERLAEEARRKAKILPDISCSCFDVLFHPVEEKMDTVLGSTIDPFTGTRCQQRNTNNHIWSSARKCFTSPFVSLARSSVYHLVDGGSRCVQLQRLVLPRPAGLPLPQCHYQPVLDSARRPL